MRLDFGEAPREEVAPDPSMGLHPRRVGEATYRVKRYARDRRAA